jgi:hypothetical protein
MKKLLLSIMACGVYMMSFASNADLFDYNRSAIENNLSEITAIENVVVSNNYSYADLKNNYDGTINVDFSGLANPAGMMFGFEDIQWGSFAWGFCCWPVGIFTVLLNKNKDSNHKISFFIGLGTAIVLSIPGYLFGGA